ncbi:glutathione S-transferase C-terminal domain-containing protein [Burkholderia pseudomultivorans]|uniref:glutathione S-transferase C-terminal domain-containing protein n=1 Tax=Burkholderia pseudomultivorans TaxID=1207504 RepID=UPI0009BE47C0|nr:glutathione S-transferase C-terminal domain-containing protein [Burkholderia pseudomultivorans]
MDRHPYKWDVLHPICGKWARASAARRFLHVDPARHRAGARVAVDDGTTLREGPVIAQYLADRRPDAGLAPAWGTLARYRLMEWLDFLTTEIHKGFIPLLYAVQAGKYVEPACRKLDSRFAWIDRQLAGRTFVTGDALTIADAYLFALTGWGKAAWMRSVYNADIDLSRFGNLRGWYERVRARPTVQAVLTADELGANRS